MNVNKIPSLVRGACLIVLGQQTAAVAASTWQADAELGILNTSGNTKTSNITAKAQAINDREHWKHTLNLEGLNSSQSGATTAERYFASDKSDYKLGERSYAFGQLTYENDRFSGYDYRSTETVGYGRSVIKGPVLNLDLDTGVGLRQSQISDGDGQYEGLLHAGGNLSWQISPSSTFTQSLVSDMGKQSTVSKSITALKTQIVGNLASKISFTAEYTTKVPPGITPLDTETAVTLVYSFK
jgi:putative salt-induced outer membrane protein